jgi:hypothetical protein
MEIRLENVLVFCAVFLLLASFVFQEMHSNLLLWLGATICLILSVWAKLDRWERDQA